MENRNLRMSNTFNFEAFCEVQKDVIGVGAIGGAVLRNLAVMNIPNVRFWDFDTVEEHNLGNQGFSSASIGQKKTEARWKECAEFCDDMSTWVAIDGPFLPGVKSGIIFNCVDKLETRLQIFNRLDCEFMVDTRMLGLYYSVYLVRPDNQAYAGTCDGSDVVEGSCSSRSTLHAASIAASLAITQAMHVKSDRAMPYLIKGDLLTYGQEVQWLP